MGRIEELIQRYCPDGVEYVQIKDIAKCSMGEFVHKNKQDTNAPYPVFNGGITNTGFYKEYNTDENKVIVSARGAGAGFVNVIEQKFWAGNSCHIISVCNVCRTNYKYLYYALKNIEEGLIGNQQKGGIPAVSKTQLEKTTIPLPPLPVQEAIVRILDTFTSLQAELQAELQARQQQYQYYRDTLLSFGGRTDVEWMSISSVAEVCRGTRVVKNQLSDSGYPVYQNCLTPMGYFDKTNCPGETPFVICGGAAGNVGYSDVDCWAADDCEYILSGPVVIGRYIYYCLMARKNHLLSQVRKASIPRLSPKVIKELVIPIPSLVEQQRIVSILDRFDTLINDLTQGLPAEIEARRQQYEYYRDRLLTFKRK